MQAGDVLVSEPLANRLDIQRRGDELELNTPQGWQIFRVIGIYYDYASSEGTLLMALDLVPAPLERSRHHRGRAAPGARGRTPTR